jgi:hypothetical protein
MKTSKGTEEAKEQAASIAEMTEVLRKNCEQALRTGLKLQEEAGRWWSSAFNPASCVQHWQEQLNAVTHTANSLLPLAQKPVAELIDLMQKNSQASAALLKKATEASQSPGVAESQAKWTEFWTSSLGAVQSNTEALSQINSRMIDSWAELIRKGGFGGEARASRSV